MSLVLRGKPKITREFGLTQMFCSVSSNHDQNVSAAQCSPARMVKRLVQSFCRQGTKFLNESRLKGGPACDQVARGYRMTSKLTRPIPRDVATT